MIVNIRGTNGSGKSTVVKRFLKDYPTTEVFGALGPKRPEAYQVKIPGRKLLYVIGPYQTATGGVDAMSCTAEELIARLEKYHKKGHILFEGVVISTYYGAVGEWLQKYKGEARVVFMDTSLALCLDGIKERGGSGTKNVAGKIEAIKRVQERMSEEGIQTISLSRENAFPRIVDWFRRIQ